MTARFNLQKIFIITLSVAMLWIAFGPLTTVSAAEGGTVTPSPTTEPTEEVVEEPTTEATPEPTTVVTSTATVEPTGEITTTPTVTPTTVMTITPTIEPTDVVTTTPTVTPTLAVTITPTVEITQTPTVEPTEEPTEEPTPEPTEEPTEEPTPEPTEEPTEEPTLEPTEEPTPEVTPEPTAAVTGNIAYQGRPDHSGIDIVTVGFEEMALQTDSSSYFELGNLSDGDYIIRADADRYLPSCANITISNGQSITLEPGTLFGGDIDNDDAIKINDATLIGSNFGLDSDTGMDPRADINADGKVNIKDLAILGGNFGLQGCQTWTPDTLLDDDTIVSPES